MSGTETAAAIREYLGDKTPVIIGLTGYDNVSAEESGMTQVFTKPMN